MDLTVPSFHIDPSAFDEKIDIMREDAVRKAMSAKTDWLESSLTKLMASGCDALAIEEHPDKTVITNHGQPVGEFRFTFLPTIDIRQHS